MLDFFKLSQVTIEKQFIKITSCDRIVSIAINFIILIQSLLNYGIL